MKALEKAAQDRDKNPAVATHPIQGSGPNTNGPAGTSARELSLESVELKPGIKADENTARVTPNPKRAAAAPQSVAPGTSPSLTHSKVPVRSGTGATQVRAATVLNAGSVGGQPAPDAGFMARLIARPVYLISGLAVFFLIVYGGYVYIQIAHPGLFSKTPPRTPPVAVTAAPATTGPSQAAPSVFTPSTNASPSDFVTMRSVFGSRAEPTASQISSAASSTSTASREISGSVSSQPARPTSAAVQAEPAKPALPVVARVTVSRGDAVVPRVNATVLEAYAALETRQFDTAQRLYSQVLRSEPGNIDALLGLAAIAQYNNRSEEAQRYFLAILDVDPRNALAQSGLVAQIGRSEPQAAESRLKQLLAREPSPPLYFNLGNLYADQGQWPQAQQAYFQAHAMEPRNPDYAYNLAVGLEHLGQQKLALEFYRKALLLASGKGYANFDSARIQERITQLAASAN